jgi:hypothetical protein
VVFDPVSNRYSLSGSLDQQKTEKGRPGNPQETEFHHEYAGLVSACGLWTGLYLLDF